MASVSNTPSQWKTLFGLKGFPFFFAAMLISLFGTGMNYAGVTWYVLGVTHSTVEVSYMVILVALPGLIVPPFGGVLIDRVDRRYLAIILDLARAVLVLGIAALAEARRLEIWELYAMVLLLGVGFAIYWATANALLQELVPRESLVGANATVLIAVQGGMAAAGALVGYVFERAGLAGVLGIDGWTYFLSAICLLMLRHGYRAPQLLEGRSSGSSALGVPSVVAEGVWTADKGSMFRKVWGDIREGLRYLREQPGILALGITYACMMAGVISANVLVVALAKDLLSTGARGYGDIEMGWALGAITGGLLASTIARGRPYLVLVLALATLAIGHALFPYVRLLAVAVAMNGVFGLCRALGGVLTQASIMETVPQRLMGRTQSAFSVIATVLQVTMSFALGWFAQHVSLSVAFVLLGLIYGGSVISALWAKTVISSAPKMPSRIATG